MSQGTSGQSVSRGLQSSIYFWSPVKLQAEANYQTLFMNHLEIWIIQLL